ncbi:endonuclease-reverse transcriptase [Plakobranchus ocellatus]|uniref:Endonuclease-reverse transcriptase n=1 Tax=Plakobranchus ocellatus TaxID=259542 RepID=A0AAV4AQG7_9GAST|nr:endonuclease-reverse transcriptase [Plakobranchus ocellatus]
MVISIFLYTCETWTLTTDLESSIKAMEMRSFRRLLGISYRDHITNEELRRRNRQAVGTHDDLLTVVKQRKLEMVWTCHTITGACQDIVAMYCAWDETERQVEEKMGRQHFRMDRLKAKWRSKRSGE